MSQTATPEGVKSQGAIEYIGQKPGIGDVCEIAKGVHWVRLPLPYALDHVNVWLLEDGAGWTLVDTGISDELTLSVWNTIFRHPEYRRPIRRVICTHMHSDHAGLAAWFCDRYGAELWMSRLEYLSGYARVVEAGKKPSESSLRFYRSAGWSEAAIDLLCARSAGTGGHLQELPESFHALEDGQSFSIGTDQWHVVVGHGHSPEHACLYCPERKLFIAGDQVLPRISSNVSVASTEPSANPMLRWSRSLETIAQKVTNDVLVLPSHQECFVGLHTRISSLLSDQSTTVEKLASHLTTPLRVVDTFPVLFKRPIREENIVQMRMATGEAQACLNFLINENLVERAHTDSQHPDRYVRR
jgi:glyoxylase-like metal-dependent hydrolase (beta-lactamase superfamily II)